MRKPLSYSSLKDYEGCPRRYHEVKVLKRYPNPQTEATLWGARVHEACERFIRDGTPFAIQFPGATTVEALNALQGDKFCELEMAVNSKLEPVDFNDPEAILRGIADLVIVNGEKLRVVDYKTGSNKYPDVSQLELMALMMFAQRPEIQKSSGALLFLAHDTMVQAITKREDRQRLWAVWLGKINRIEHAHETDVWNAKPSGLCNGWCPCTDCEHWKPKRS